MISGISRQAILRITDCSSVSVRADGVEGADTTMFPPFCLLPWAWRRGGRRDVEDQAAAAGIGCRSQAEAGLGDLAAARHARPAAAGRGIGGSAPAGRGRCRGRSRGTD